jgi:predicted transcriptional regulator
MSTATTQKFTLHLPEELVEALRRAAQERCETPDAIVAEALRFSLQPVRQEALRRLKSHVREQQDQSEPEIRAHLEARLTNGEQERLSQLLERNRTEGLTTEERAEMQALFDRIEAVATEKAAAIWLLSERPRESDAE